MEKSLFGNNYTWPPKMGGDPVTVTILDSIRVEYPNNPDYCYSDKHQKKMTYRDEFQLEGGKILPCNTWRLYFALQDANVRPGDTITITHPGKGEYGITINDPPSNEKLKEMTKDIGKEVTWDDEEKSWEEAEK